MKTFLKVIFNSEGTKPSEIVGRLRSLGFSLIKGEQDMVYNWPDSATADDAIWFADKIQATLQGFNVYFELETMD
ncbi:hypothetical protein [Ferroplasma sp.]|uniref:hypothetical protein n=1 Tax=Ferroplasma sp. TaxID=2591003 RepID=UPI00307EB77C